MNPEASSTANPMSVDPPPPRRRRWLRRVSLGILVALVGALAGSWLVLRSSWFKDALRDELIAWLNRELRGTFSLARIEGSLWRDLRLVGIDIRNGDTPVLQVDELHARFELDPQALLAGRFAFAHVELVRPVLRMHEDKRGDLDIATVFEPRHDDPDDEEPDLVFLFPHVELQDADVRLDLRGNPDWQLRRTEASGSVEVRGTKVRVQLDALQGHLVAPGGIEAEVQGRLSYDDGEKPTRIEAHQLQLHSGASRVVVDALLRDASGHFDNLEITGTVGLQPLAGASLTRWVPELRREVEARGTVAVAGNLDELAIQARLQLAGGRAELDGVVDTRGAGLPFSAMLHTDGVRLDGLTAWAGARGSLRGRAAAAGQLSRLAAVDGSLDVALTTLSAYDRPIGDLELQAQLTPTHVAANATLHGAYGSASLRGDLHRDTPARFAAELDVDDLDAALVPLESPLPTTRLDAQGVIEGEGLTLDALRAQAKLHVGRSDIDGVRLDEAHVEVGLADQVVQIHRFEARARGATLHATGAVGLALDGPASLSVGLSIPRLDPWGESRRVSGRGRIEVVADVSGTLAEPRLQAQAKLNKISLEEVSFRSGTIDASLSRNASGWVGGAITALIEGIKHPIPLTNAQAQIDLTATARQGIHVAASVTEPDGRQHRLRAELQHDVGTSELTLHDFASELPWGTWTLVQPSQAKRVGTRLEVEPTIFLNGDQRIEFGGSLGTSGSLSFAVHTDDFSLENLVPVIPSLGPLSGNLNAGLRVSGTAAAPMLDLRGDLLQLRLAEAERGAAHFEASYRGGEARADLVYEQDEQHRLVARAALPVAWRLDAPTEVRPTGELSGRIESEAMQLDILASLLQPHLGDFNGQLHAAIDLGGTLDRPRLFGTLGIDADDFKLAQLGVRVKELRGRLRLDDRHLRLEEMYASARDGELRVQGSADLDVEGPAALDLALTARDWPPIWTKRYQALVGGELRFSGSLLDPSLGGELRLEQAYLKPDLKFLERNEEAERDTTIRVIDSTKPQKDTASEAAPAAELPSLLERLTTDVVLKVKRNTRIKHEMADVELRGELRVRKQPTKEPEVVGVIEAVRGWLEIQGRQFKIQSGEVRFAGGRVANPRLNVVAVHRKPPYEIEARLGGTVEKPTLALSSDPALEQADILAVLLFGRPTSELDEGEKTTLQERALGITSGFAAGVLGKAVSEALGLESLGVDMRDIDLTGGRVGIGRYLLPNLYVSVTQGLGEDQGNEVTAEYYLTRRWKVVTSTDSLGNSGADLIWQTPY